MDRNRPRQEGKRRSLAASFLSWPARAAAWLSASAVGRFFHAYEKSREVTKESRIACRLKDSRLRRAGSPLRRKIGELATRSPLSHFLNRLGNLLRYTETRTYGILFGTFGLYTILVFLIRYFAQWARGGEQSTLLVGIIVTAFSLPLLFSSAPMYITLQESHLLSAFFYRLVGLPQYPHEQKKHMTINPTVAFLLGSLLGIVGFFLHPLYLIAFLLCAASILLLLFSPELCIYTALALCPFFFLFEHPSLVLAVILLAGLVGYLWKLLLGKRVFSFEPLDLTVLLLGLMYLVSAFFSRGGSASAEEAVLYAVLLLGYFLTANLLNTPAAIRRAVIAVIIGGAATAALGLYQQLAGEAVAAWLDNAAYDYINGRITAAFGNPNILATYLILLFPFVTAGLIKKGSFGRRLGAFLLFLLFMGAIVFTWSRGAWLGVILSLALFLFAYNPATLYLWLPAAAGSFFALQHFGSAITLRLSSAFSFAGDSSISYRLSTWRGALGMIGDHWLSGIGVGEAAFHACYPYYALSGIESAPHAHNLLLQYWCEFGIAGPLLLLLFILTFFQCVISHRHTEPNPTLRLDSLAAAGGVLAVLVFGLTDHVFYNARIFFLFFAVAGMAAAISRVGRIERVRNTPLRDTEAEAYAIEIEISEA